jgi:FMN phosphatase YigB (HAD superfamily)
MLKAVLLDLDNTMVLFDEITFYKRYFEALSRCFADFCPADELMDRVLKATMALGQNEGGMSNSRFFLNVFMEGRPEPEAEIWARFLTFYENNFDKIAVNASGPDALQAVLDRLQEAGLRLVLASNPIYPKVALEIRMAWAGIEKDRFCLTTHIENMSYVKPRTGYYRQVCEMIAVPPEECLMVGNDPVNDMAAATAGLKTFLTTDGGVVDYSSLQLTVGEKNQPPSPPEPDYIGTFAEVARTVEKLRTK